ncbi:hypothetical protein Tco_1568617 [Tanacetum coccineum]
MTSYNNTIGLVHTSQGVTNKYNLALSSCFNGSYPFTPNMGFVNFQSSQATVPNHVTYPAQQANVVSPFGPPSGPAVTSAQVQAQYASPQVQQGINSFGPGSYSYAYSVLNLYTLQVSTLPQAFHTMTHQDPSWNMDTGASSHLADNTSILTSFSNLSIYPYIFVGNGNSIPVTHTGHSFLHTSYKPLHLNHILVTPHINKNLIYVRKFTRDNDVSVEFDAYGFSVKDYQTQKILLRCDSTGDLYLVTQQPLL